MASSGVLKLSVAVLLSSTILWCAQAAHADASPSGGPIGVFPVQGTNLEPGELEAIGALFAITYDAQSPRQVLAPAATAPALAQYGQMPAAARALGLRQYVELTAVRLQQRIALHATLRNVHGSALHHVKTTALSLDDLEPVTERMAAALVRRTELEYTRTRDNVIGRETRAPNRVFAEKIFGVRSGVVLPLVSQLSPPPSMFAQFDGRLEGQSYFLEFAAGLMLPSRFDRLDDDGVGGLIGTLGASYYLGNADVAPYIGGGFAPRIMFGAYRGAALSAGARLGLMFMRQSSSRFYIELAVDQHLLPLGRSPRDDYDDETGAYRASDDTDDDVYPTELGLAAGIGW